MFSVMEIRCAINQFGSVVSFQVGDVRRRKMYVGSGKHGAISDASYYTVTPDFDTVDDSVMAESKLVDTPIIRIGE